MLCYLGEGLNLCEQVPTRVCVYISMHVMVCMCECVHACICVSVCVIVCICVVRLREANNAVLPGGGGG